MAGKIQDKAEKIQFLDELTKENPDHLPLYTAKLEALKGSEDWKEVVATADKVLGLIDEDELARSAGFKAKPQSEEEKKAKKEADTRKEALLKAYWTKAQALIKLQHSDDTSTNGSFVAVPSSSLPSSAASDSSTVSSKTSQELENLFNKYRRWFDSPNSDPKYGLVYARRELANHRFGTALSVAFKVLKDAGIASAEPEAEEAREIIRAGIEQSGWRLWKEVDDKLELVRKPKDGFALF